MTTTRTPAHVQQMLADRGARVLDVRSPGEFATGHIPAAANIPVDQVAAYLTPITATAPGPLVLVCHSGPRAEQAARTLTEAGHTDHVVLDGGMSAWIAAGLPLEQAAPDQQRWALERQVPLVAGSITLTSVLASTLVPRAKWGAAFIGGGLTFAALSNTCMMGNLLSRLPYNQGPGADVDAALTRLGQAEPA